MNIHDKKTYTHAHIHSNDAQTHGQNVWYCIESQVSANPKTLAIVFLCQIYIIKSTTELDEDIYGNHIESLDRRYS